MSMTILKETIDSHLDYFDGPWTMKLKEEYLRFLSPDTTPGIPDIIDEKDINLISDEKKILVSLNIGLYNFYYTCVVLLLRANRQAPDATMILDVSGIRSELNTTYYKFLFTLLDDLNIKYVVVDPLEANNLYVNNFYKLSHQEISNEDIEYFYKIIEKYIKNKDIKPFRKVYISRKYIAPRDFPMMKKGLMFSDDNRILNQKELEDYVTSCGFEIVYPEDFDNFIDQINYFYEAHTILSVTSSGITNCIFMQPGNTLIELITPLVMALGNPFGEEEIGGHESIHHIYHAVAYNKRHAYIGVPNFDRDVPTISNTVASNPYLSKIFSKEYNE